MTHQQAINLLSFNTIIFNEEILMPDYIIEKFESLIGKVDDLVKRELLEEEELNKELYLFDFFKRTGGYTKINLNQHYSLSVYYDKSVLLNNKEKTILIYLKRFKSFEDIFSNYEKYIGDLSSINDSKFTHVHPRIKGFVNEYFNNKEKLRIINLYKLLY